MVRVIVVRRWVDPVLATLAVGLYWFVWRHGGDPLGNLPRSARENLLQSLAGVAAALLGFGSTAVAIVFALAPPPRLAAVIRVWGWQLNRLLAWSLYEFAGTMFAFLAIAGLDSAQRHGGLRYGVIGGLACLILAVLRLLVLLAGLLSAAGSDAETTTTAVPEEVDPDRVDFRQYRLERRRRRVGGAD